MPPCFFSAATLCVFTLSVSSFRYIHADAYIICIWVGGIHVKNCFFLVYGLDEASSFLFFGIQVKNFFLHMGWIKQEFSLFFSRMCVMILVLDHHMIACVIFSIGFLMKKNLILYFRRNPWDHSVLLSKVGHPHKEQSLLKL